MKVIIATGKEVLVDDDFEVPDRCCLYVAKSHGYVALVKYAGVVDGKYKYDRVYLHRYVSNAPKGLQVDHINGNRLDNRSANLRICTSGQNNRNIGPKKGKYKGVHWTKNRKRWVAQITKNYKTESLGCFDTAEAAALAYNEAAKRLHGEYAYLNKIDEGQ